jgi:hypothetical protein
MYAEALMGLQASQRTEQAISIGAYAGDWNNPWRLHPAGKDGNM